MPPSGLSSQIGFATETVYGQPVTVTRFLPLVSESLAKDISILKSDGMIANALVRRSQQWSQGNAEVGGDVDFELFDRSIGLPLRYCFGDVVTAGSGPFTHTFTPGDLSNDSFTCQVGRPDTAGTVHPFTYYGCVVDEWQIGCAVDELATFAMSIIAKEEVAGVRTITDGATTNGQPTLTSAAQAGWSAKDIGKPVAGTGIPANTVIVSITSSTVAVMSANATATGSGVTVTIGVALAAATYAAGVKAFTYINGSLTVAGSSFCAQAVTLTGNNGLSARRCLGKNTIEALRGAALREYTGTINAEFDNLTAYNRFLDGAEAALVLNFTAGAQSLVITMNVMYTGDTPNVEGADVLEIDLPFECVGTTTDASGITAVLTTSEASP